MKICIRNQWWVVLTYITDFAGVANIKDPQRRPLWGFSKTLKIQKSWTDYPIVLKLSPFYFSGFFAFLECTKMSGSHSPLKIHDIHTLRYAIFMFKFTTNTLPSSFHNLYTANFNIHSYPTLHSRAYHLCNPRLVIAQKSIRHHGHDVWNKLPLKIKTTSKPNSFKALFKKKQTYFIPIQKLMISPGKKPSSYIGIF